MKDGDGSNLPSFPLIYTYTLVVNLNSGPKHCGNVGHLQARMEWWPYNP